jgi:ABC-type transporter Mla subunit MlaD
MSAQSNRLDRIGAVLEENGALIRENSQQIRGINAALNQFHEAMLAFAQELTQSRERQSQLEISLQSLTEAQRITQQSVERLSNTVERLATEAAIDRAEIRQIWEYLMRTRGNGLSD